jgi:hypothetical protein
MFLGVMCDLTIAARSRRMRKESAETSAFKQWLDKRDVQLEQSIRRQRVARSKFLSYFFDQVASRFTSAFDSFLLQFTMPRRHVLTTKKNLGSRI